MTRPFQPCERSARRLVALFAIVLICAAYVPLAWHHDHTADQDCTVCKLGHQPLTASPDFDVVGHAVSTRARRTNGDLAPVVFFPAPFPPRAPPA